MTNHHTDLEMLWIDAWTELHHRMDTDAIALVGEDFEDLSLDACKGRIQDEAYDGRQAVFRRVWVRGQCMLQVTFQRVRPRASKD